MYDKINSIVLRAYQKNIPCILPVEKSIKSNMDNGRNFSPVEKKESDILVFKKVDFDSFKILFFPNNINNYDFFYNTKRLFSKIEINYILKNVKKVKILDEKNKVLAKNFI